MHQFHHRGEAAEMATPSAEPSLGIAESWPVNLPREKAGLSGCGRVTVSLFNIKTTEDMVGLSIASS